MRRKKVRHFLGDVVGDDDLLLLLADGTPEECENEFAQFVMRDVAAALWAEHGDAILASWIRHSPGCRPWAFWAFEAPGPRRLLSGKGRPVWGGLAWGIPASPWEGGTPKFESQGEFLARHDLLLPGEGPPVREPHPEPRSAPHWCVYR